jgi:hypothetical protein
VLLNIMSGEELTETSITQEDNNEVGGKITSEETFRIKQVRNKEKTLLPAGHSARSKDYGFNNLS